MNRRQLAKLVGHFVRVFPIPQVLPGGHPLQRNCWQVSKPRGSRNCHLHLAGSVAAFELTPDLMSNFWHKDWIILRAQMTITDVNLDFTPLSRGQAEQMFRDQEQARFRMTRDAVGLWNKNWAVWIQPGVVAGGMPLPKNAVPGSDGL